MSVFAQETNSYAPPRLPQHSPNTRNTRTSRKMRRFNKMCKLRNTPPHNTVNPTSIPRNSSTHLRSIRHNTRIKHQPNTLPSSLITLRHRTPLLSRSTRLNTTSRFSMTTVSPTTRT